MRKIKFILLTHFVHIFVTSSFMKNAKFYVYEWPDYVFNSWPKKCNHHMLSTSLAFRENYGIGQKRENSTHFYHTHQYSIFTTFYFRLLESPKRTLDPSKASLFFIPYDIGMDSTTREIDGALTRTGCPRLESAIELLNQSVYFNKNNGADHFIIHSINQPMLYFTNKCIKFLNTCYHCIKLSIDVYTQLFQERFVKRPAMLHNWISIPFPSDIHYFHQYNLHQRPPPWKLNILLARKYAITFIGSMEVTAKLQRQLRLVLRKECLHHSRCLFIGLDSHVSNVQTLPYTPTPVDGTPYSSYGPYHYSDFCLMPGGDFPTRKAVLDALLVGCVPVTFQLAAAHQQWPIHWGSDANALACLLYIPRSEVMRNVSSVFTYLVSLSNDLEYMVMKRKAIASIAHRMQYNVPRNASSTLSTDTSSNNEYDSKYPDAVDIILSYLLDKQLKFF